MAPMADASAAIAAAAGDNSKTRFKRTRTGCLKCRVRRRKCDEGKPKCKRCRDGGFDCQYGTKLSFLDKNSLTAPGSGVPTPQSSYSTLRFVEPGAVTASQSSKSRAAAEPASITNAPSLSPGSSGTEAGSATAQQVQNNQRDSLLGQFKTLPSPPALRPPPPPPPPPQQGQQLLEQSSGVREEYPVVQDGSAGTETSPSSGAYDTALDVLLSLSHESPVLRKDSRGGGGGGGSSGFSVTGSNNEHPSPSLTVQGSDSLAKWFPNCSHLPQTDKIQLLRHYRYNIAPWLDIGDPDQTFGLQVTRMSSICPPILEALLGLALASVDQGAAFDSTSDYYPTQKSDPYSSPAGTNYTIDLVTFSINMVRHFVLNPPLAWRSPFHSPDNVALAFLNSSIASQTSVSINTAAAWVLLRLDVTIGLLTSSPVSIPNILASVTSPSSRSLSRGWLGYDREPIVLCARVLNYCFARDPAANSVTGTVQTWLELSQSLNIWYANRPQDFKAIFDLEEGGGTGDNNSSSSSSTSQLFPTILFTNGAAILANQIYHTAMLLLLQHRPRTIGHEAGRSILVSPLWHAQRICGISLNNDDRSSWDFSQIASLCLAARRMTYEPQQHAILAGVQRIHSITGWNLSGMAEYIRRFWQSD